MKSILITTLITLLTCAIPAQKQTDNQPSSTMDQEYLRQFLQCLDKDQGELAQTKEKLATLQELVSAMTVELKEEDNDSACSEDRKETLEAKRDAAAKEIAKCLESMSVLLDKIKMEFERLSEAEIIYP